MPRESVVEIPAGSGNKYRYAYEDGATVYKGPVGDAPGISEQEFLIGMPSGFSGPLESKGVTGGVVTGRKRGEEEEEEPTRRPYSREAMSRWLNLSRPEKETFYATVNQQIEVLRLHGKSGTGRYVDVEVYDSDEMKNLIMLGLYMKRDVPPPPPGSPPYHLEPGKINVTVTDKGWEVWQAAKTQGAWAR